MKVITVANGKGGVGKTTTSIYLALAIHEAHPDSRLLLLDLDPQKSATEWGTVAAESGDALPFDITRGSLQTLKNMRGAGFVVVDTAPAISDAMLRSLSGLSDIVVVPTEAEGLGLAKTYKTVDICKDKAVVLLTRIRPRTRIYSDAVESLDDAGVIRFDHGIPDSVRYKSYGMTPHTIGEYAPVLQEIEQEIAK